MPLPLPQPAERNTAAIARAWLFGDVYALALKLLFDLNKSSSTGNQRLRQRSVRDQLSVDSEIGRMQIQVFLSLVYIRFDP
jgi:hypothetical protein